MKIKGRHSAEAYGYNTAGALSISIGRIFEVSGGTAIPKDRIMEVSILAGILLGILLGYERHGMLYGVIGASMGTLFGAVGGLFAGLAMRYGLGRFLTPMPYANRMILSGRPDKACDVMIASVKGFNDHPPLLHGALHLMRKILLIHGHYLPPHIAASAYLSSAALISQHLNETPEAARLYLEASNKWPGNLFAVNSLLELIEAPELLEEIQSEVTLAVNAYNAQSSGKSGDMPDVKLLKQLDGLYEVKSPTKIPKAAEKTEEYQVDSVSDLQPGLIRIIETPSRQVSNGILEVSQDDGNDPVRVRLAAMPFQLLLYLAQAMTKYSDSDIDEAQMGWIPIDELIDKLPWTISSVTSTNVHKLVYKLRKDLSQAGLPKKLIEENQNGFYRLQASPELLSIELAKPN